MKTSPSGEETTHQVVTIVFFSATEKFPPSIFTKNFHPGLKSALKFPPHFFSLAPSARFFYPKSWKLAKILAKRAPQAEIFPLFTSFFMISTSNLIKSRTIVQEILHELCLPHGIGVLFFGNKIGTHTNNVQVCGFGCFGLKTNI